MSEKGPIRTCIGCNTKFDKENVLRFVADYDGNLIPDINRKLPGRGASVCLDEACVKAAIKKKAFVRQLKSKSEAETLKNIAEQVIIAYSNYLYTLLRLGFGGRKVIDGLDICSKRMVSGDLKLCLLVEDISENSLQKIKPVADKCNVKVRFLGEKRVVAEKVHRPIRAVYGIVDKVLAKKVEDIINKIDRVKTWIG